MPWKRQQPCTHPGCGKLSDSSRCEEHRQQFTRAYEKKRGSSARRGYGQKWQDASRLYLMAHPWCARCNVLATEVDHKVPHKGDMKLFWDRSNWESLCKPCHSRKTATEDGRWGSGRLTETERKNALLGQPNKHFLGT